MLRLYGLRAALGTALAMCAGAVSAQETADAERLARACMAEVRADGSYEVVLSGTIPQVAVGDGGNVRDARNLNDCLADKYQVQSGLVALRATNTETITRAQECRQQRGINIGTGIAVTAVTIAVLGGTDQVWAGAAAGSMVGISGVNQRYRECLRGGSNAARASSGAFGCQPGEILVGGSSYCR